MNILTDPQVAVIFLVPDHGFSLRIAGRGRIVRDSGLNAQMEVHGKQPELALVVTVEEAFMHCAKALIRSGLWQPETWPEKRSAPTLAEWQVSVEESERTLDEIFAIHTHDEETRLY